MARGFLAVLLCASFVLGQEEVHEKPEDTVITHARVESCGG
uniref:Selenoprotein M-like protein n=1 Tax=Amblyomma variegatum TaxID=34610 RepID=F0JA68_AMBVA|nr:TPA: selenoprotein M-like protein [Amblyomma variegatum]